MGPFSMFPRQWTPVVFSRAVKAKPVSVTIADTPVVLFRDGSGRVRALLDRCAHRGAQLSRGSVVDGCIQCPFHGWRYDGDGACVHVPLGGLTDRERANVHAIPLPTHEAAGMVFVFTAPGDEAPALPHIPGELTRSGVHVARHDEIWNAHWSRAMENMLDASHLPFVHRHTIGRALRKHMRPDSVMNIRVDETPDGFRTTSSLDTRRPEGWLEWNRPNGMVLNIPIPNRTFRQHVYCVPIDAEHTRMILLTTRDFSIHNPIARLGDLLSLRVMYEDRRIIEGIRPREVPPPDKEHSARTDRATLTFRRWYCDATKEKEPTLAQPSAPDRYRIRTNGEATTPR